MVKALLGFLAGALFATAMCFVLEAIRRGGRGGNTVKAPPAAPEGGGESASPEALAAARSTLVQLQKETEALRSRPETPDPGGSDAIVSRADVARRLAAAYGTAWHWDTNDERTQALMFDLLTLIRDEAERAGVSIGEAAAGPEGLAALALELARAAEPPPDEATLARMEEALGAMREGWEEYLGKRAGLSTLERSGEMNRLTGALYTAATGALGEDHYSRWSDAWEFWWQAYQGGEYVQYSHSVFGNETDAKTAMSKHWATTLRLDEDQKVALRPIVDEYMRAIDDLTVEARSRNTWPASTALLDPTIKAQRRMAESLGLSPSQEKALAEKSTVYTPMVWKPR